jgi:CheY-like chemotaxis protein
LIVEDDAELRSVLGRGLEEEGFTVEAVATGGELLARVASPAWPTAYPTSS